jgi:protein arginine N-methyltransferase 7
MYSGTDKEGGVVVSAHPEQEAEQLRLQETLIELTDVLQSSGAEEIIVCRLPSKPKPKPTHNYPHEEEEEEEEEQEEEEEGEEEEGRQVLLKARLELSTGELVWEPIEDELGEREQFRSIVGGSQMTSMLHDLHRNSRYEQAIDLVVKRHHRLSGGPHVLDIGTGTGLLAMMAARSGAKKVTACEMFSPLATLAEKIIHHNQLSQTISLLPFKSTQLSFSSSSSSSSSSSLQHPLEEEKEVEEAAAEEEEEEEDERADILVTETFDSVLLGEGILPTLRHAKKQLLKPNATILPRSATIQAVLVSFLPPPVSSSPPPPPSSPSPSSPHPTLLRLNGELREEVYPGLSLARDPLEAPHCRGFPYPIPIHASLLLSPSPSCSSSASPPTTTTPSSLPKMSLRPLTKPFQVAHFDFQNLPLEEEGEGERGTRCSRLMVEIEEEGVADGVLFWWCLDLADGIDLDMRPHPGVGSDGGEAWPWQDHWHQMLYLLPPASSSSSSSPPSRELQLLKKGSSSQITTYHSDFSIWFHVSSSSSQQHNDGEGEEGEEKGEMNPKRARLSPDQRTTKQRETGGKEEEEDLARPNLCTCGLHLLYNWQRLSMICDKRRNQSYGQALKTILNNNQSSSSSSSSYERSQQTEEKEQRKRRMLDIGDGSLLAMIGALEGAEAYSLEQHPFSSILFSQLIDRNSLSPTEEEVEKEVEEMEQGEEEGEREKEKKREGRGSVRIVDGITCSELTLEEVGGQPIDVVVAEPYFSQMVNLPLLLPLTFWSRVHCLRERKLLSKTAVVMPAVGKVVCAAVELGDLWRSYGTVGKDVSGFDHTLLDEFQEEAWHHHEFAYPLWMYRHRFLTQPQTLLTLDFSSAPSSLSSPQTLRISVVPETTNAFCHAVAIWVNYELLQDKLKAEQCYVSTGPTSSIGYHKQSLYFFPAHVQVTSTSTLIAEAHFNSKAGKLGFSFMWT